MQILVDQLRVVVVVIVVVVLVDTLDFILLLWLC